MNPIHEDIVPMTPEEMARMVKLEQTAFAENPLSDSPEDETYMPDELDPEDQKKFLARLRENQRIAVAKHKHTRKRNKIARQSRKANRK